MTTPSWSLIERLPNAGAAARTIALVAGEAERPAIARQLDLHALNRLEASVRLRPWLDGAELRGAWSADVTYVCGVSLEPFDQTLEGAFTLHLVPAGSPHAPAPDAEISLDPDAPEPPDVVDGATIDVAAYVVEHLALELDLFPRKPGVEFVAPEEPPEPSPFGKLLQLRPTDPGA